MALIHWFRRDLRVRDNPALAAALRAGAGAVIPVFIFDDAILSSPRVGAVRVEFLLQSLRALDEELRARGSRLVVRHGPPAEMLRSLVNESGAEGVFFNRDYTPFARARDEAIERMLRERGLQVETFQDLVICEPDDLQTKAGKPYTVYSPYRRQWQARVDETRQELLATTRLARFEPLPDAVALKPLPSAADLGASGEAGALPGGEAEGLKRLKAFVRLDNDDGIGRYHEQRDLMARPATSRLSPYLHMGCVSTGACLRAALLAADEAGGEARQGIEGWIGELAWHDFYMQILFHFPHVLKGAFKPQFDALAWENDEGLFAAWREGRTGYPVVDAAMRQLNSEGWMHNRARMIVGSFLVKDLLIDWRWGERYFLQQLVDGDHAANNGGWQWVAGTGTDPQPYFRIFNPVSQGQRYDPEGAYVRHYLPELADVPDRYIQRPWAMPADAQRKAGVELGRTYPRPVVDHAARRKQALALYRRVAKSS